MAKRMSAAPEQKPPIGFDRALRVEQLCVARGERLVIDRLDMALETGEALKLTGPNGVGKSTLLRAIAGLLPHSSGVIALSGGGEVAMETHYLAHADGLRAALSVAENLEFWAAYLGGGAPGLPLGEALKRVGLAHVAAAPVAILSAGQKRRVALARLLVARRPLWLLDEPLTALDVRARGLFAHAMREHLASGGMIVAATHEALGVEATRELALGARRAA
jgi:heme exporter protein A